MVSMTVYVFSSKAINKLLLEDGAKKDLAVRQANTGSKFAQALGLSWLMKMFGFIFKDNARVDPDTAYK